MSFINRVDLFWQWFLTNEPLLSSMALEPQRHELGNIIEFVDQGVELVCPGLQYNIGGQREFTFAISGQEHLFYLLPYLVSRMPEGLEERWHFYPFLQGTGGAGFGFSMYGVELQAQDLLVSLEYDQERDAFTLAFYHPDLCALPSDRCHNAFALCLELALGESRCHLYIDRWEAAPAPATGMFPLPQLEARLTEAVTALGQQSYHLPGERFVTYSFEPDERDALRYDVYQGSSCFPSLLNQYYARDAALITALDACGAQAVFLYFDLPEDLEPQGLLELRYHLEARLQQEVLGPQGSGLELGLVLGGAIGYQRIYIDLLLFDLQGFLELLPPLLEEYPHRFFLSEFQQKGRIWPINAPPLRYLLS